MFKFLIFYFIKEETFTQTGRRGADGQLGREDVWQSKKSDQVGEAVAGGQGYPTFECR